jgi:hypothetical protein
MAVKTQHGSVKQILVRGLNDWGFDLIYAAGLFDYLSQLVVVACATCCLQH